MNRKAPALTRAAALLVLGWFLQGLPGVIAYADDTKGGSVTNTGEQAVRNAIERMRDKQRASSLKDPGLSPGVYASIPGSLREPDVGTNVLFLDKMRQLVAQNWSVPSGSQSHLHAVVAIALSSDGRLLAAKLSQSSGETSFDISAVEAVESSFKAHLPTPLGLIADRHKEVFLDFVQ